MKTYYFIEHKRRGVFIREEPMPRFTQKRADSLGKRFATRKEAQDFLEEHLEQWKRQRSTPCTVIEKELP